MINERALRDEHISDNLLFRRLILHSLVEEQVRRSLSARRRIAENLTRLVLFHQIACVLEDSIVVAIDDIVANEAMHVVRMESVGMIVAVVRPTSFMAHDCSNIDQLLSTSCCFEEYVRAVSLYFTALLAVVIWSPGISWSVTIDTRLERDLTGRECKLPSNLEICLHLALLVILRIVLESHNENGRESCEARTGAQLAAHRLIVLREIFQGLEDACDVVLSKE